MTGAGGGIGRAVAVALAARGARVAVSDVDEDAARAVAEEAGGGPAIHCDVSDRAAFETALAATEDSLGGLDALVNNAGVEVLAPLGELSEEAFDRVFAVNVKGVWHGMSLAAPRLAAAGGGSIVNVSSVAALGGGPLFGAYSASKAAVLRLTETAALELRPANIRVNAVCPGLVQTAMLDRLQPALAPLLPEPWDDFVARKQGRPATAEEVAAAVVHLLDEEEAGFTNGIALAVDNGLTAGLL
ncbi:MAG TPA: SDR family oxidoreductase [Thermoleophilaceae bacterium]|nr:SDR family oxidoreductase [Thermoleophilaceae bacterium]